MAFFPIDAAIYTAAALARLMPSPRNLARLEDTLATYERRTGRVHPVDLWLPTLWLSRDREAVA